MFKGHPKGLFVAFFTNMGERFGFYTMIAILAMFLQAKYNLGTDTTGWIYSIFMNSIYALALLGGFLADRTQNYKGVIMTGIIVMLAGYLLLAIPGMGLPFAIGGLLVIAFGNGLFKGNLQALVGQLYDDPKYSKLRDSAFSVFYMGINIGAFFAPSAASGIRSWYLGLNGFKYDADMSGLCNQLLSGTLKDTNVMQNIANNVAGAPVADLHSFAQSYLNVFSTGYNYAFGIAAVAMFISLIIYFVFKKHLPDRKAMLGKDSKILQMSKAEEKKRMTALFLVFFVVIFFWMSFQQSGLTLTWFARDYTVKHVGAGTNILFYLFSLIAVIAAVYGLVFVVRKASSLKNRIIGSVLLIAGIVCTYLFYKGFPSSNPIEPEIFQQFNPIFIVVLTPVVIAFFAFLRKKNIEPSTPRKIAIGMILAAVAYAILAFGSFSLLSPTALAGQPSPDRVSSYWLINTYLILTFGELFLSPMGISFVSKVAPPRFQGLMQGGWFAATAVGNQLLVVGSFIWTRFEVWHVWGIFVVCCLLSAGFVFTIIKRLESVAE